MNTTKAIRKRAPTSVIWRSRPQNSTAVHWRDQPGRLRQAAVEITANHPGASPDDVLLWAEARALPVA